MDKQALERSLARRLLGHIEHRTTDLADDVLEVGTGSYSPEHHAREVEVLFLNQPLVFCLSGGLPGPGTFRTVDLCGTPVLLTRDATGQVRALANICRHRGVRVADGAGRAKNFTCPFHAWTYDLGGGLVAVPTAQAFEGMCRELKGLVELPVAEGYGLIVGRLRPGQAVDIDDYLGLGLADELALLDFADWEPQSEPHVHRVGANWKVTLDTFRENYHFNYLHRRTLAKYAHGGVLTFDSFGPHLRNCSAVRTIDELRGRPESEWGDVSRHISLQYALFPNTSLTFDSPACRPVADPAGRARPVRGRAHLLPAPRPERGRAGDDGGDGAVDLRDRGRRRGLLGGRPDRARAARRRGRHRGVRAQ